MKTLSSRRHPIVSEYRALRKARERHVTDVLLDGVHVIEEAVAANIPIRHVALVAELLDRNRAVASLVDTLRARGTELAIATRTVIDASSPVRTSSGIVAIARRPADSIDRVLARSPALVIIAAGIQDPGNLGAIVRAAEAGGATGLIVSGGADPFGWKALRGAMGSAFRMPIGVLDDPREAIRLLRQRHVRVLASSPRGKRSLFETTLTGPTAIAVGGEGAGLDSDVLSLADDVFAIPMAPPVESLNVAVAAALAVYEACRQRHAHR
jgi:TrmH family RNA methyltransferase